MMEICGMRLFSGLHDVVRLEGTGLTPYCRRRARAVCVTILIPVVLLQSLLIDKWPLSDNHPHNDADVTIAARGYACSRLLLQDPTTAAR